MHRAPQSIKEEIEKEGTTERPRHHMHTPKLTQLVKNVRKSLNGLENEKNDHHNNLNSLDINLSTTFQATCTCIL